MTVTTGDAAERSVPGPSSERPGSADQYHLAGALRAAAAARSAAVRIRAAQCGSEPPLARPVERPPPEKRHRPTAAPVPRVPAVVDARPPTPRGLSVTEAARASRMPFRPLRRGQGALPYRTDYRPLPSRRRPAESARWIGAGPPPDPNDYWPMVRDRLLGMSASINGSTPVKNPPPTVDGTLPIAQSKLRPTAASVVEGGPAIQSAPPIVRVTPPGSAPTPAEKRDRIRFSRTIAELERLRAAATRPSASLGTSHPEGVRNHARAAS